MSSGRRGSWGPIAWYKVVISDIVGRVVVFVHERQGTPYPLHDHLRLLLVHQVSTVLGYQMRAT